MDVVAYALLAAGPAALVVRRRLPSVALTLAFAATLAYALLGYARGPIFLALIIAFFTAVLKERRGFAWTVLALGYGAFLFLPHWAGQERAPSLAVAVGLAAWLLLLAAAAEGLRARRRRAIEEARNRDEEARRRASEERLQIARELHDVLAHNISLINVQAGVALHLIDERPEQARSALATIKDASRETLREMRSVLGALRRVDEDLPRSPTPSLARIEDLIAKAEASGLQARVKVDGRVRKLPAGTDLAAFRIIQEALTNVARHSGRTEARVRISYGDDELLVQVDDDGLVTGPASASASGGGNGIPGMRERAAALGGTLRAGIRPGGGFRVHARLPLAGSQEPE